MEKYQVGSLCRNVRIELHYLPGLAYFAAISPFDTVWLEAAEHYQKQSYRNRCYVLTANGVDRLTVPVLDGTHHQPIRNVRIDYRQPWPDRHWQSLVAAYGKAPFFEYYAQELRTVLIANRKFLFDLNLELLTICLKWLGWKKEVRLTETFEKQVDDDFFDLHGKLKARGDDQSGSIYRPVSYPQNFGNVFVPNLSLMDLIFNQGPHSSDVLKESLRQ
ncbi:WbqC family protein [Larkinella soli]|uniref:WbqC family protein n=1 Tax=Larkinella soli TaxID=1770527 RepID=UPI000FFC3482|nr:WbqC family protein [Larkinella soli]